MKINLLLFSILLAGFTAFAAPEASETFLLWPGTPPGAEEKDVAKTEKLAKSIEDGTYKIPNKNRRWTRIPTCDVYLPPKEKATGAAVVVYCGGAYGTVCIQSEGIPVAKYLTDNGIAVFMVAYRCLPFKHPVPHWDVQRAIRVVRKNAKKYGIKKNKIGIMGFSAGGHVASTLSVHYDNEFGREPIDKIDKISARPDFSILIYPVISLRDEITHIGSRNNLLGNKPSEELIATLSNDEQVDKKTPPALLVHGKTDSAVKFINSQRYYEACLKHKVKSKYILMERGNHGPGFMDGKPSIKNASEDYAVSMVEWIEEIVGK